MGKKEWKIRSRKYRTGAKGQACVNCGVNDGTVVLAHYQGIRGQTFGKGVATKPHDVVGADLCHKCHTEFDAGKGSFVEDRFQRKIDLSERFMYCCFLTVIRRVHQGILHTDDMSLPWDDED
jgi:hypothetical protein